MLVHVVKAFASTAPLIAASSTLKQQQRQQQRTAREREMKKRNEREVRADVEKNSLHSKRSAALNAWRQKLSFAFVMERCPLQTTSKERRQTRPIGAHSSR